MAENDNKAVLAALLRANPSNERDRSDERTAFSDGIFSDSLLDRAREVASALTFRLAGIASEVSSLVPLTQGGAKEGAKLELLCKTVENELLEVNAHYISRLRYALRLHAQAATADAERASASAILQTDSGSGKSGGEVLTAAAAPKSSSLSSSSTPALVVLSEEEERQCAATGFLHDGCGSEAHARKTGQTLFKALDLGNLVSFRFRMKESANLPQRLVYTTAPTRAKAANGNGHLGTTTLRGEYAEFRKQYSIRTAAPEVFDEAVSTFMRIRHQQYVRVHTNTGRAVPTCGSLLLQCGHDMFDVHVRVACMCPFEGTYM